MLQTGQPDPDQDLLERLDRRERLAEFVSCALALGQAVLIGLGVLALTRYAAHWRLETALDVSMLIFITAATVLGLRAFSRH